MSPQLVCTGRGTHDPVEVYGYDGPWPPEDPSLFHRGSVIQLDCPDPRCPRAPRPSRAMLVKLLTAAATRPDGRFDVSMLAL
jgi:hypothetical protein